MDGNAGVTFSSPGKQAAKELHAARKHMVGRDYFETAGSPMLAGRDFRKQDERSGATAVIVSAELVREYWKGEDPLGRRIEVSNYGVSAGVGAMPGSIDYRAGVIGKGRRIYEVVGVRRET